MRWVLLAFRIILGAVFLYAGLIKASSSGEFALALLPFTFVPDSFIGPLARLLPWVEVLGGVLVLLPWTQRVGAALIGLLCAVFIAALTWALANDIVVACSCFGRDDEPSRGAMLLAIGRDIVLIVLAGWVAWPKRRPAPAGAISGPD